MSKFAPTRAKVIAPAVLVGLSFVPGMLVQQGFFGTLSYPLSFIYHGPPFVYRDKPWYITPLGAIVTAIVWALLIYVVTCLFSARTPTKKTEGA